MNRTLEDLMEDIQHEAQRAEFPVDRPVYEKSARDPSRPILCAGEFDAPVCVFGRDLGRDEVAAGEPLIGAAGRLVRVGICKARHGTVPATSDRRVARALDDALLTNTVPYKPPGNKAYAAAVKERFRPFVAELLGRHWKGDCVITLGTEAFLWFMPYGDADAFNAFWRRADRYEAAVECVLKVQTPAGAVEKLLTLLPLPHPSPLNQRWYQQFPTLLGRRLSHVFR
jgi:uracil-DNA glycosylase